MATAKKKAMRGEKSEARGRHFTMRISEEEEARFERVAEHYGLTIAGALRMLMKRADDEMGTRTKKGGR